MHYDVGLLSGCGRGRAIRQATGAPCEIRFFTQHNFTREVFPAKVQPWLRAERLLGLYGAPTSYATLTLLQQPTRHL